MGEMYKIDQRLHENDLRIFQELIGEKLSLILGHGGELRLPPKFRLCFKARQNLSSLSI